MSHDVDITEPEDKVYCSFVFGVDYCRVFTAVRGPNQKTEMSELITRENLTRLKAAIDSHLDATSTKKCPNWDCTEEIEVESDFCSERCAFAYFRVPFTEKA